MSDTEGETRHVVELMLGTLNESHIIRTIEYWDIERQRYPTIEHRAVIIAEEIVSRFFNVIRLLNRSIPIVAIQLSAFRFNDEVILQFVHVLNTYEFSAEPEEESTGELVDRAYWEKTAKPESLAVVDAIKELIGSEARITYNKYHIALGTTGYNFCWLHPRRIASHCHMRIKVGLESREQTIGRLEAAGVDAENQGSSSIRLHPSLKDVMDHRLVFEETLRAAEQWSHR